MPRKKCPRRHPAAPRRTLPTPPVRPVQPATWEYTNLSKMRCFSRRKRLGPLRPWRGCSRWQHRCRREDLALTADRGLLLRRVVDLLEHPGHAEGGTLAGNTARSSKRFFRVRGMPQDGSELMQPIWISCPNTWASGRNSSVEEPSFRNNSACLFDDVAYLEHEVARTTATFRPTGRARGVDQRCQASGVRAERRVCHLSGTLAPALASASTAPSSIPRHGRRRADRTHLAEDRFVLLRTPGKTATAPESSRIHSTCSAEEVS